MIRFFGAVALLACVAAPALAEVIDLGGPRQVRAEVTLAEGEYRVRVQMLPVTAFDATTNAALNRDKARMYALQALARHLSEKPDVRFTVRAAAVDKAGLEDKRYTLTLRVDAKDVRELKVGETAKPEALAAFTSRLFTVRAEFAHTLDRLSATLIERTDALRKLPRQPPGKDTAFEIEVAGIEEVGTTNLDRLTAEVKAEPLLLQIEKDELLAKVVVERAGLLTRLAEAVEQRKPLVEEKPR